MQIKFVSEQCNSEIVVFVSDDGKTAFNTTGEWDKIVQRALASHSFEGKVGQFVEILAPEGVAASRIIVLGLGKKQDTAAYEQAGACLVKKLGSSVKELSLNGVMEPDMAVAFALGARLAAYRFDNYRTKLDDKQKLSLETLFIAGVQESELRSRFQPVACIAEGVELARDLVSEPPNILYPESYANRVSELSEHGLKVKVLDEEQMRDLNMNLLLGVGQGSIRESRLCVIEWNGADNPNSAPLALVGKGVTFDTGGISIKPPASMDEMKGDMGGSAAVVGTMKTLARRKAKANVVGVIGLVENMPGGNAIRPGDIIASASGQTVEVLNTDAEGRLVLADALWYVQKFYKPSAIIDLATLTGAIIIALGHEYAGMFTNDDNLAINLKKAGEKVREKVWQLPLGEGYNKMIDSKVADIKNISSGRGAGSITAAQFLKRFVNEDIPWAHLDIAGKAWKGNRDESSDSPVWATGFGVRLLNQLVADNFEK